MPDYLCHDDIDYGVIQRIDAPVFEPSNGFNLVWVRGSLRRSRIALAKRAMLEALTNELQSDAR